MGHTRRIAKGGAATPDIFKDPFVDKQPPPEHENLTGQDLIGKKEFIKYKARPDESTPESIKRTLYYIYLKWKESQGQMINQPGPIENVAISKMQHDELREFLLKNAHPRLFP